MKYEEALIDRLMDLMNAEKKIVDRYNNTLVEKRMMFMRGEACEDPADEFIYNCQGNDLVRKCDSIKCELNSIRSSIGDVIKQYTEQK